MSEKTSLVKRFDGLIELGKTLLPFQNDLKYLATKQKWMTSCQHILEKTFGRESAYYMDFQNLPKLGNQEAHVTHGLALMEGARDEVEKGTIEQVRSKSSSTDTKKVFIVHGRDYESVKELKAMLLELGLNPIILHEQPSRGKTVVEKLEDYSQNTGYAFVILTPDDGGFSDDEVVKLFSSAIGKDRVTADDLRSLFNSDETKAAITMIQLFSLLKHRARQNVVMEFGYFWGLIGRDRVCCLYKGDVELPSDMHGIVYISFKESVNEARDMIVKELKAAGYEIVPEQPKKEKEDMEGNKSLRKEVEELKDYLDRRVD